METLIQVTRVVQCQLDEGLLGRSTKKSPAKKNKFTPPINPIDIIDDYTMEPNKDNKRKQGSSVITSKKKVFVLITVTKKNLLKRLMKKLWLVLTVVMIGVWNLRKEK